MAREGVHPGTKETALQKLSQLPQDAQEGAIAEAAAPFRVVDVETTSLFMELQNLIASSEAG
jgi:hypothetical protein